MENYRKTIKTRIVLFILIILLCCGIVVCSIALGSDEGDEGFISGFQCGVASGVAVVMVILTVRYTRALRDEKSLQMQYNRENDEMVKAVKAKAGLPMLQYTSIAIMLAGVISGYFDMTVFKTLIATGAAQLLASLIVKAVYMRKYGIKISI